MKTAPALFRLLAAASALASNACEAVSDLDAVRIAPSDAALDDAGPVADAAGPDATGQGPPPDATNLRPDAGSPPADAGSTADAAAPDAPDASPFSFPPTCVKPGAVLVQCDPRTNAGCAEGTACDMGQNAGEYAFACFPAGEVGAGGACDGVSGPYCQATLHCGPDLCTRFCCTSADCAPPTPQCGMYDPGRVGTFGWCI